MKEVLIIIGTILGMYPKFIFLHVTLEIRMLVKRNDGSIYTCQNISAEDWDKVQDVLDK